MRVEKSEIYRSAVVIVTVEDHVTAQAIIHQARKSNCILRTSRCQKVVVRYPDADENFPDTALDEAAVRPWP